MDNSNEFPCLVTINYKSFWGILDFFRYLVNRIFKVRYSAELDEPGLLTLMGNKNKELYNKGAFGKGLLSRGEANWFERNFLGETPDGLKDKKRLDSAHALAAEDYVNYKEPTILMPQEAMFLSYALGCLDVYFNGSILNNTDLFELLSTKNKDFATRYAVYHYYRSRGWVVRSGFQY